MSYRLLGLLLFFTLNSSLASGQWESDQFLFSSEIKPSRPKAVKSKKEPAIPLEKTTPSSPTSDSATFSSSSPEVSEKEAPVPASSPPSSLPVVPPGENSQSSKRAPSSIHSVPPLSLKIQVGSVGFQSRSDLDGLSFNRGSYAFGADVALQIQESSLLQFSYLSAPHVSLGAGKRIRWEEGGFSYLFKLKSLTQSDFYLGAVAQQSAWWRSKDNEEYSLQPINAFGINSAVTFLSESPWTSELRLKFFPWATNDKSTLRGTNLDLEGILFYRWKPERAFTIQLGYEEMSLKSKGDSDIHVRQGLFKFFLGYRISPSL